MKKRKLWWGKKSEYTPLKYLESSGTQYIDLGIKADLNTKAEIAFCFPNASTTVGSGCVFGSRESSVLNGFGIGSYSGTIENGTKLTVYYSNGNTASSQTTTTITVGQQYVTYISKDLISQNGFKETGTSTDAFETPRTLKLFGFENNTDAIVCGKVQISSCRIIQDNVLIRDMIPVLDKQGVPCMWDRVNDKLYYNKGTGDFSYEEWDYTPVDYVYANGSAYTSTMLYGNSDTKMEMVFDVTAQSTQNRGIIGSRGNSANSQLLAIGYGTSVLASDFNNSSYATYRASIIYDLNTKYRVYTSKEKRSIIDEATGTVLDENNTLCTNNMSTGALLLGAETGLNYRHVGNIYETKIWDGATLIRDYIPVVDGDNKAGFYDKCLNIISYSVGTSDFVGHIIENGVDYKVVKSIGTSGTQYIETGLSGDCRWVGSGQSTSTCNTSQCLVSSIGITGQFLASEVGSNKFWGVTSLDGGLSTVSTTTKANFDVIFTDTLTSGKINNDTVSIAHSNTMEDWRLFSVSSSVRYTFYGKVYWLKAYQSNKIVRHYIPVVRGSTAGMFDTVERKWYGNDGTGSFTYTE